MNLFKISSGRVVRLHLEQLRLDGRQLVAGVQQNGPMRCATIFPQMLSRQEWKCSVSNKHKISNNKNHIN
jgi:hypothetical protein